MWRITDDLWDKWELVYDMFTRCEAWQPYVERGCYPDCDMLPLGKLGKGFGNVWECNLTKEEQKTMMSLWCIFRSPLMLGAEMTLLDDWTLKLLSNDEILEMLKLTSKAEQVLRTDEMAIWKNSNTQTGEVYIAIFNFGEATQFSITSEMCGLEQGFKKSAKELWSKENIQIDTSLEIQFAKHGAKVFRF